MATISIIMIIINKNEKKKEAKNDEGTTDNC